MSLLVHSQVAHEIAMVLAHLDEDGSTRTAGVTHLAATAPSDEVATDPADLDDEASTGA
jgi:hypothetical protein